MTRLAVREAEPEDAEAICRLHKASVRRLCAAAYSSEEIEAWVANRAPDDFRIALTAGGEAMFVAASAGQVVGFASTRGSELLGLYVDSCSGRGAGRSLLRAVERHARSRGFAILSLQATLNAVAFYERHGFLRHRPDSVMRGGRALPVVAMRKDLGPAIR
jgi:putative acetyltransferase